MSSLLLASVSERDRLSSMTSFSREATYKTSLFDPWLPSVYSGRAPFPGVAIPHAVDRIAATIHENISRIGPGRLGSQADFILDSWRWVPAFMRRVARNVAEFGPRLKIATGASRELVRPRQSL